MNVTPTSLLMAARWCAVAAFVAATAPTAEAQLERQRANPRGPVEDIFWAPSLVGTSTVTILPAGSLDFTIMHSFGLLRGGVSELFGLDGAANIRFGLDYSVHDRISVGIGRSRFDKLFDGRVKATVLRQSRDGRVPVEIGVQVGAGVTTTESAAGVSLEAIDRLSYMSSVLIARRFSRRFALQVAPLLAHMNTVFVDNDTNNTRVIEENTHLAVAAIGSLELMSWLAVVAEFVPVVGRRSDGTNDVLSVGVEFDTGGHVFQVFLTTTQWFTPQHLVAKTQDDFLDGDFRLGFNVHRVFSL